MGREPPPHDDLTKLFAYARLGDVLGIQEYAAQLVRRDPSLNGFAQKITHLANNFLIEELQKILADALEVTL